MQFILFCIENALKKSRKEGWCRLLEPILKDFKKLESDGIYSNNKHGIKTEKFHLF